MWPLWLFILVAVAGAAVLTTTGVLLAIHLERRRHQHILQAHGLTRGLSRYHRPKLSANEENYSHVTPPTTHLRRSIQMPYRIVSIGHNGSVGEDEENQGTTIGRADECTEVLRPRDNKSGRRPFSGRPLCIPKSRRPGKLRKTVPLERIQKSPLSAITEFSDPPTSAPHDAPEFPTHSSTIACPGNASTRPPKHISTQWPLAIPRAAGSNGIPTEVLEFAARQSVLMRKDGGMQKSIAGSQPSVVPRSVSAFGMTSTAPDEHLPPVPSIESPQLASTHNLRPRSSNTSLDTIGSSVLGAYMSSPAKQGVDLGTSKVAMNRRSLTLDLSLKQEFPTPKLQAPPVKRTIQGLVPGKSVRSLHPCVDDDDSNPVRNVHHPELPTIIVREESFKTIDASKWELPPLKVEKIREQTGRTNRHSMIEEAKLAQWRTFSDSTTGLFPDDDVFSVGEALKRPNSVATGDLLQWDRRGNLLAKRHSLTSLDGQKRGHKRQNCIRITNLPFLDVGPGSVTRMPELREEQQPNSTVDAAQDPRDGFEIKQPRPTWRARPSIMHDNSTPTPSLFTNAPVLTPTARPTRRQYIRPPSASASGTPRPDSEVFDASKMEVPISHNYTLSPRQWPLSPTIGTGIFLNETPPSAQPSDGNFDSPILPSPALNSASLYLRKSLVKGPRSPYIQSHNSRGTSTSPPLKGQGHSYRVLKDRDSSGPEALHKSVMMLRSMNADGRLLDQQSSTIYQIGAEAVSPELRAEPSPPLNKPTMGASSVVGTNTGTSPTTEKQHGSFLNRGSSPLGPVTTSHAQKLHRNVAMGTKAPSGLALHVPASHLSLSPSIMSASGSSIWEDASVRAESPEPGPHALLTPLALQTRENPPSRSSSLQYRLQHQQRLQQQQQAQAHAYMFPIAQDIDAGPDGDTENEDENVTASHLVQKLERVASSRQWGHKVDQQHQVPSSGSVRTELEKAQPVTPRTRREMDVFGR